MNHRTNVFAWVSLLLAVSFLAPCMVRGVAPRHIPDEKLAEYPVIVLAQWDKTPFRSHCKYLSEKRQAVAKCESYTTLKVIRVLKGDIKPGEAELMLGWGIAWGKDGKHLSSGTSTTMAGEVDDVTKPNLWFLERKKSWDEKDKREHLSVANYRCVQDPALEPFFAALGAERPAEKLSELLESPTELVVRRALQQIAGGWFPWPIGHAPKLAPVAKPNPGADPARDAARVRALVENTVFPELRPFAVAVYAQQKGRAAVPYLRGLLRDADPTVRGIATAQLARHRDEVAIPAINRAIGDIDGLLSARIIEELRLWNDPRIVPALIRFLDSEAGNGWDENGRVLVAPGVQEVLHGLTGHWFPHDVEASLTAWEKARSAKGLAARKALLADLLPYEPQPLQALLAGTPAAPNIRLTNRSKQAVTVSIYPERAQLRAVGLLTSFLFPDAPEWPRFPSFITLEPGESWVMEVKLSEQFFTSLPDDRSLRMTYRDLAAEPDGWPWIGILNVGQAPDWHEKQEIVEVVETWPNGNLKATGTTVNGRRRGTWVYFNQAGDRIRTKRAAGGTAIHDPEHPNNKGAGIRPRPR